MMGVDWGEGCAGLWIISAPEQQSEQLVFAAVTGKELWILESHTSQGSNSQPSVGISTLLFPVTSLLSLMPAPFFQESLFMW